MNGRIPSVFLLVYSSATQPNSTIISFAQATHPHRRIAVYHVFCKLDFLDTQGPALSTSPVYRQISTKSCSNDTVFRVKSTAILKKSSLEQVIAINQWTSHCVHPDTFGQIRPSTKLPRSIICTSRCSFSCGVVKIIFKTFFFCHTQQARTERNMSYQSFTGGCYTP